jgi:putative restriction endonuclease
MRGYIGVTDYDWYQFLQSQVDLDEVNFWRPSGKNLRLAAGTPFLFKLKAQHDNVIAGFGFFARSSIIPASLAWDAFTIRNGAPTERAMRTRIEKYREAPPSAHGDYDIGCLMISQPTFFPPGECVPGPSDWGRQTVSGSGYDLNLGEGRRVWEACLAQANGARVAGYGVAESPGPRYGTPTLVAPRLGQGTFRVAVTDAYGRACAVTTEHSLPVLEAAHIKPFADDGPHDVSNGLLLRSDLHRLFDRGYVTVTPEGHFEVSRRLKEDFDNGRTYYALQGKLIQMPQRQEERPAAELLAWHNEHTFLAA